MEPATDQITSAEERRLMDQLAPLFRRPEIRFAVVFGSAATGQRHGRSDLDLALMGDNLLDLLALTNEVIRLIHRNEVDVVDLRRASPMLAIEVVRHGRLLYERTPGLYVEFCVLAYRRYADTAKLRDAQRQVIMRFLGERGLA